MTIGKLIRERRKAAGHSLRALAALVDVHPSYLSRVETGKVPASDRLISDVSSVLALDATELFLTDGRIPPKWQSAVMGAPGAAANLLREAVAGLAPLADEKLALADEEPTTTRSAIEAEDFPFEYLSRVAEAESWRKEINRPVYHVHKWWAQRLGSVFRGILIGCFAPPGTDVMELFYRRTRIPEDAVVFDPFMGSGTTVGETLKLGGRAVGRDINPVSTFIVRNATRPHSRRRLVDEFANVMENARRRLLPYYRAVDGGHRVVGQYYFWVKYLSCPECSSRVDLFRTYVFSKHTYASKHPDAKVVCPACGQLNERLHTASRTCCDHCGHAFDASRGPARGMYAHCPTCRCRFRIAHRIRSLGTPPPHRMFAKVWIDDSNRRRYRPVDDDDHASFSRAAAALRKRDGLWPHVAIQPGHNTNQALNNGYTHWHHMFNDRQLLVLGELGRAVAAIEHEATRDMLLCAFSGLLEFNNMFASFKGEGSGAVRHMFSHHVLKPERTPFETNPLTANGSGTFEGVFRRRVLRALDYARSPFEVRIATRAGRPNTKIGGLSVPIETDAGASACDFSRGRRLWLSTGDSAATRIPTGTVDAVVTDPPFFDNVNYSELADFFWVWQRHLASGQTDGEHATTRSDNEVQHQDEQEFARRLGRVWTECRRVLASNGLLVFTYHHSRPAGWAALLASLAYGGFVVTACHPVKSELSLGTPKSQAKEPIDVDVVFVCRSRGDDPLSRDADLAQDLDELLADATAATCRQVKRFAQAGRSLGRGDVRVTMTAQVVKRLSWRVRGEADAWLQEAVGVIERETTSIMGLQRTWEAGSATDYATVPFPMRRTTAT